MHDHPREAPAFTVVSRMLEHVVPNPLRKEATRFPSPLSPPK